MGKMSKGVKTSDKIGDKLKVKKLVNKPGISKSSSVGKVNLKDARVPLMQILKNKSDAAKNVTLLGNANTIKVKKQITEPVKTSNVNTESSAALAKILKQPSESKSTNKPKREVKVEAIPLMKTLKRKSVAENSIKLPTPKKKTIRSDVAIKKQKKEVVKNIKSEEPIVQKKNVSNIEGEQIPKKESRKQKAAKKKSTLVDEDQVKKGVSAVLKLHKLQAESKKLLFDGEHQPIFLQVSCIKVPKVPTRLIRMMLPHTLVTDTDDVALFAADMQRGRKQDFEPTINHYQDLLRENGCTQIKDVIPLTQLKTEWGQYELKRKLLSSYDFFLVDGKISGHMSHLLGKIFKRKMPTSIRMNGKDLKREVDKALKKTRMQLHSNGDSHIVQVAHTAMKKSEILENVLHVCKSLDDCYPGGWPNIRNLILKTSSSLAVPIYLTLKSKNKVKVPVIKPKRPKAHRTVVGELSTASGKNMVFVRPDGTVILEKFKDKKTDEADEPTVKKANLKKEKIAAKKSKLNVKKKKTAVPEIDVKNKTSLKTAVPEIVVKNKKTLKNKKPSAVQLKLNAEDSGDNSGLETKVKSVDDSEEEIEEAEQEYLSRLQRESSAATTEEKTSVKKQSKIVKKTKKRKTKA